MPKTKTTDGIKDHQVVSREEWIVARKKLLETAGNSESPN